MPLSRFAILPLTLCLFTPVLMAQTVSAPRIADEDAGSISLGAAVLVSPEYAGSSETRVLPLPYIDVYNYKGFDLVPFTLSYSALDYTSGQGLWAWGVKAGPQASWEFGRQEDDGDELIGLGDLDSSVYLGGYTRVRLGPLGLRLEGGQDVIDGTDGSKLDATIGTRLPIAKGSVTAGYSFNWGSDDYVQSYFGVTPDQARASQFDAYALSSGVYATTATLLGQFPVKNDWEITALASYRVYVDDVADSPILSAETGASDGLTVIFGLSKRFGFKN